MALFSEITTFAKFPISKSSKIFNLDERTFGQLFAQHKSEGNPYDVLGVKSTDDFEEIQRVWKQMIKNNHPDKLIAQGMPQDIIENNTYRLKEINNAWDLIKNKKYDLNA